MRGLLARPTVRRGLIVALDGLALWLLAFVLAAYADPGSVAGASGGLVPAAIDTTLRWATTPGVGGFELLAYAGLAVATLGPLWYWVGRPGVRRGWLGRLQRALGRRGDGFRFDQPATSDRGRASTPGYDRGPADGSDLGRAAGADHRGRDRLAELFDSGPGPGGHPHDGAGRSADDAEPSTAVDGRPADGAADPDAAPTDEIVVAMDERDEAMGVEITVGADDAAGSTDAAGTGTGGDVASPADGTAIGANGDPADEGSVDEDAAGPAGDRPGGPTARPATADEGAPARWTDEVAAAIDEVRSGVMASRKRIEPVTDRIAATADGSEREGLRRGLVSVAGAADDATGALRAFDPDEPPIIRRVPELRASQRRIEAAFDAFVDGE